MIENKKHKNGCHRLKIYQKNEIDFKYTHTQDFYTTHCVVVKKTSTCII